MEYTVLRKLTRKSRMKFGKYADICVQELLHRKRYNYLIWVYFNCDKITFMNNILDEIRIPDDFRIEKPGKNPKRHLELTQLRLSKLSKLSLYRLEKRLQKRSKVRASINERAELRMCKKGSLESINHGHNKHKTAWKNNL